jgi:hypothetical protein
MSSPVDRIVAEHIDIWNSPPSEERARAIAATYARDVLVAEPSSWAQRSGSGAGVLSAKASGGAPNVLNLQGRSSVACSGISWTAEEVDDVELPPVPDPAGHPRPPAAPRVLGSWSSERHRVRSAHHRAADQLFVGPSRQHPLLESVGADRPPGRWRTIALGTVVAILPVSVVMSILIWFTAEDRMESYLILAGVAGAAYVLFFWLNRKEGGVLLHAGAQIVAELDLDGDGTELLVYELRSIKAKGTDLRLVGSNGWRVTLPFGLLEANQQLWDLVYNGIRHSEAAGAEIDARTRQLLDL